MCYYLNDIIKFEDLDFDILKIFWITTFHTKTLIAPKPLHLIKIDGFIRNYYDGNRYLTLFVSEKW